MAPPFIALAGRWDAFSLAFGVAANFVLLVRRMLGVSVLATLFVGKYHRPREGHRILMFVDLDSSTALAERLGQRRFHAYLNRFFFDLSEPVRATKGMIYRYAGDGVVVSWLLGHGVDDANCLRCCFAIRDRLEEASGSISSSSGTR